LNTVNNERMSFVLGIDLGTSSTKTVLLDESGNVVAAASASYPLLKPQPNWVEQDPADWWRAVCATIRAVLSISQFPNFPISSVALSGQMNGAVFVDARGNPLRPAPLWLDGRSAKECDEAQEKAGDLLRRNTNPTWQRRRTKSSSPKTGCGSS
jgi:xylulokinase